MASRKSASNCGCWAISAFWSSLSVAAFSASSMVTFFSRAFCSGVAWPNTSSVKNWLMARACFSEALAFRSAATARCRAAFSWMKSQVETAKPTISASSTAAAAANASLLRRAIFWNR